MNAGLYRTSKLLVCLNAAWSLQFTLTNNSASPRGLRDAERTARTNDSCRSKFWEASRRTSLQYHEQWSRYISSLALVSSQPS